MPNNDAVEDFFATYPAQVADLAGRLRKLIKRTLPKAEETLDTSGRVVGYSTAPGYKGLVCTIIPSKQGVNLGVVNGAALPDPGGLLEGAGKKHRYVVIGDETDIANPAVAELLLAAVHGVDANS